ncbi:VWA domain-containing protein [Methanoculleus sp. FWC-SCC1]|uniref:VWA domain-containing protein n=1 Tax=Methanoculleus frigidifontis TaxID=2584085 RepID=A0ABT8M7Z6_9EURY|nr:magnesium chelatase subunit D family protein [Methanoculleus sp. FWC-SCC1]MDN7024060.1 VWA domain-containing protein [Methanoculleus sp. FWC-SCC1]
MPHHVRRGVLPFTAIIGQETMKRALLLNAVNPRIGGVLIRGEKGTAKSTAVRGLADLLPEIEVVAGCPFGCNPADQREICDICCEKTKTGGDLAIGKRRVRVVDLPLGATEDRVVGTIDIERAIKEGVRALEPGILAQVNRGILYIDEVNLLDDHVTDILLDAAAMGVNTVEREGISVSHPARFILIGTMNPEEGELRPQLLDRFGLQVTVAGIAEIDQRIRIVETAEAFESDPEGFRRTCEGDLAALREQITAAKRLLPHVAVPPDLIRRTAETCVRLGVDTHRAEIAVIRTAKTIAALEGRSEVTLADIREAMELALPHRMRRRPFEEPRVDPEHLDDLLQDDPPEPERETEDGHREPPDQPPAPGEGGETADGDLGAATTVHAAGSPIDAAKVERKPEQDRKTRRTADGRRVPTYSARKTGRYVAARETATPRDVALDATIRAAAPYQNERPKNGLALAIRDQDIREKVRIGRVSTSCLFLVDASGSMGAVRRMEAAKGAVLSLLEESYLMRDRVGLIAFCGSGAENLLPLCSSADLAVKRLEEIPTGGKTPLPAALALAADVFRRETRKNAGTIPIMVLLSDGRGNVSLSGDIRRDIERLATDIGEQGIHTVVLDTESTDSSYLRMQLGYCREIAERSGGRYYPIGDLAPEQVHAIVEAERNRLFQET